MWAVLYACEHIYDTGQKIVSYADFFDIVRQEDRELEAKSKVTQGADIGRALNTGLSELEAHIKHPDDDYYWRWVNRNGSNRWRQKRISELLISLSGNYGNTVTPQLLDKVAS